MRYVRSQNKYRWTRDPDLYSHFSEIGFIWKLVAKLMLMLMFVKVRIQITPQR
jgi:hypothetical protein